MKQLNSLLAGLLLIGLLAGCANLPTAVVTLTRVADDTMKEAALLEAQHKLPDGTWPRVVIAHDKYRAAASAAQVALIAYQNGGDKGTAEAAFEAARAAVGPIIDLIISFIPPPKVETLKTELAKASKV